MELNRILMTAWPDGFSAGAYFAGAGVKYICVAGKAVTADRAAERRTLQRYAHSSYSQARWSCVCECWEQCAAAF